MLRGTYEKSIIKIFITVFAVIFFNNCSVGDYTDLWPTEPDENSEVVIREIPGDSFDPEDTEEIVVVANSNEEDSEITIIDEITENEDNSVEFVNDENSLSDDSLPDSRYSNLCR